jgi:hypothetical protein
MTDNLCYLEGESERDFAERVIIVLFEIVNAFREIYDHLRLHINTDSHNIVLNGSHMGGLPEQQGPKLRPGIRILIHHNLAPFYLHPKISRR